jgi:hypothetical protein
MFGFVYVALDPVGNVSLILQITILFLLILGLPFVRGAGSKKNFVRHGYSTALALVLHFILIFVVMVPSFLDGFGEISELSLLDSFNVISHVVLGVAAAVMGAALVIAWLSKGPSTVACARWKKWMTPTFAIWVISIVGGTFIHILGML